MIHLVETGEGEDLSFRSRVGVFLSGYWGDGQGQELSSLILGQACTLNVAWRALNGDATPQEVVLGVYAPAKSASGLGDALFELEEAAVQDGLLRVEWTPPESPGAWPGGRMPAELLFLPQLSGWGTASGSEPWQHPIVALEVARIVRSGWENGSESAGTMAKVEVAFEGLDPGPVTFRFTYLVGATEVSLEGLEDVESELSRDSLRGETPKETLASAEWRVPLPRLLQEAAERAGLDPAAEEPSDALLLPDPTPAPRRRHTLRFKVEAGEPDNLLCASGDLDVEEVDDIHVRCVEATQTALSGAEVQLCEVSGDPRGETLLTNEEGEVRWEGVPIGPYVLHVQTEAGFCFSDQVLSRHPEASQPAYLVAPPQYEARIRVVDEEQVALSGAEVRLCDSLGGELGEALTTDEAGEALWSGIAFRECVVEVFKEGDEDREALRFCSPVSLREVEQDAQPQPCWILTPPLHRAFVRVVDQERTLLEGTATLCYESGEQVGEQKTLAEGEACWKGVPAGSYVLDVEQEGFRFSAPLALRPLEGEVQPCEVIAPAIYQAPLRVVNASQEPLAGAEVRLCSQEGEQIGEPKTADDQGDVVWDKLPMGDYVADVDHEGLRYSAPVGLRASGETAQPCFLVAPEVYQAPLRVLNSDQEALSGAEVWLCREDGEQVGDPKTADASGDVLWTHLPPGDYVADVRHEGLRFSAPVALRGSSEPVQPCCLVAPETYQALVCALDAEQEPLRSTQVRLCSVEGEQVGEAKTTDSKGVVSWRDLDWNDYVVQVAAERTFSSPITLRLQSGNPAACTVLAPRALQARVRVLDEEGNPIGGASVALHRSTGQKVGASQTTGGQGDVKWDVDHDDYVVHVSQGGRSFSSPISLRSDPTSQPCLVVEPLPL